MPKVSRKISICLDLEMSQIRNCYVGVAKAFYVALKDHYDVEVINRGADASDILFFHNSIDHNNTKSDAKHKFLFCHNTMQLGVRADCYYGHYRCVANSEIMRDTFYKNHGRPFEVDVVHNFPNWELRDLGGNRNGVLWLTRLYPHTHNIFREFVGMCRGRNIVPTVVSSMTPPEDTQPFINRVPIVQYEELEDFLNQFEYGVGIGRSAMDMALCGIKTTVAGIFVPEPLNPDTIERHIQSNFNSILNRTDLTLEEVFDQSKVVRELVLDTMSPVRLRNEVETILKGVI